MEVRGWHVVRFRKIKVVDIDTSKLVASNDYFYVKESEETEVKSKEELIEKWESAIESAEFYGKGREGELIGYMKDFVRDLSQLEESEVKQLEREIKELDSYNDELVRDNNQFRNELDNQEVLSPDWLEENEQSIDYRSTVTGQFVESNKLQNLIVPKQERVKVPQLVADWLDDNIERYETVYSFIISTVEVFGDTVPEKVWTYASENPDTMARAYLDGYEVTEEPKYRLKLNDDYLSSVQIDYASKKGEPIEVTILADVEGLPYNFSEDEKAYVEKYLNVEVEEME